MRLTRSSPISDESPDGWTVEDRGSGLGRQSERFQVFEQGGAVVVAELGAVLVSRVGVAGDGLAGAVDDPEFRQAGDVGAIADRRGVELERADGERREPVLRRAEELVETGDGAVVQIRGGGPDAVERPPLVFHPGGAGEEQVEAEPGARGFV